MRKKQNAGFTSVDIFEAVRHRRERRCIIIVKHLQLYHSVVFHHWVLIKPTSTFPRQTGFVWKGQPALLQWQHFVFVSHFVGNWIVRTAEQAWIQREILRRNNKLEEASMLNRTTWLFKAGALQDEEHCRCGTFSFFLASKSETVMCTLTPWGETGLLLDWCIFKFTVCLLFSKPCPC